MNPNKREKLPVSLKRFFLKHFILPQPQPFRIFSDSIVNRVTRYAAVFLWFLFPFFCLISAEYICFFTPDASAFSVDNTSSITRLFTDKPLVLLLDLLAIYIISLVITLVAKRLWVSCAVVGVLSFVLSTVSFFKFQNTGEYFYPWDLRQTGNVGLLSDYINTDIPTAIYLSATVTVIVTVFILLTRVSLPIHFSVRLPIAFIIAFAVFISCSSADGAKRIADSYKMNISDVYRGAENYNENGFFGALMLNLLSENVKSPDEYSEDAVMGILSSYSGKDAKDSFDRPNIVVILQESFWDVRQLPGCTFSKNPLENYDRIIKKDGVYSGYFVSPTFGGGTVRPEFELLTGLTADYLPNGSIPYQYIEDSIESYPSILRDLGYNTLAIHPYLSSFYTRDEKYPLLGFDSTLFEEDLRAIESLTTSNRGGFVSDDSFVGYIEHFLKETNEPLFLFGISMEGHQPYGEKFGDTELEIKVTNPAFDAELSDIVTQYSQCLMDADASLGRLTRYIDSLEEDTLLVVFGDHAPSLGNDKAAYRQSGFISEEGLTSDDMDKILKTPFFIYANFEAEDSTMLNFDGDNIISPYNLMNAALELCGAPETPLMEFLKDYYSICKAYNIKLTMSLDSITERFIKAHEFLSHDRLRGEGYSQNK